MQTKQKEIHYSEVDLKEEEHAEILSPKDSEDTGWSDQMETFCDLVEQIIWENPYLLGPNSEHVHRAITRAAVRARMAWGWDEETIARALEYAYKVIYFEPEDRQYAEDPEQLKWWESLTDTEREEQMDRYRRGEVKWIPDAAEEVLAQKVRKVWNGMTEAEREAEVQKYWRWKDCWVPEPIQRKIFWSMPHEEFEQELKSKLPLDVKPEWLKAVE